MNAVNATAEEYSCRPCGEEVHPQQQQEVAEETPSKALAAPVQPTEQIIEDHRASGHLPFRNWCSACVRGRGRSYSHIQRDKSEEVVTTISIDYGFFGSEESPDKEIPVLVVKDRRSKALWAHLVPSKGVENPHVYRSLFKDLNSTGYKKIILKSDQEPAITALAAKATEEWHGEVIPAKSPKGESKANGEVERVVQEAHGLARTIKEDLQIQLQASLPDKCPLLAWLIEFSAVLYTIFHKGEPFDGMTPYRRLKGKNWTVSSHRVSTQDASQIRQSLAGGRVLRDTLG